MSLTRKMLEEMGIEEETIDLIIDAHTETFDAIKADRDKYKSDAEKLPAVQKELDDLKAKADDGWKEKHDKVKGEFDAYKKSVEQQEAAAAREKAVRAYFESKGISGKNLEIAVRGSRAEIDGIELDGDSIKDTSALDALVGGDFSGLVATTTTKGAQTATPPASSGGSKLTKADIYKKDDKGRYVMSAAERQKALAENPNLMN